MDAKVLTCEECYALSEGMNRQYAIPPEQQKVICEYAMKLGVGAEILEIGIAHGTTATILIAAGKGRGFHYSGIDNFSLGSTYEEVKGALDKLGEPYDILVGKSSDTPWNKPIDLLIIDGGHYEEPVKADCEKYIPFVKPGGVVMFHDWDEPYNPQSAHWSIHFYGDKNTQGWEDLGMVGNLKIKRKPL